MTGEVTREEMVAKVRHILEWSMPDAERLAAIKRHWIDAKAEDGFHYWPHRSGSEDIAFLLRELEAGWWRPRETVPDTDDPILGYSPIAGNPAEDEQAGHYAITEGSFLRSGGWAACTLWRPIAPPTSSDGGGDA